MPGKHLSPIPKTAIASIAAASADQTVFALSAAIAPLAAEATSSSIHIAPLGKFRAYDGRPSKEEMGYDDWHLDQASLAAIQSGERGNDIVVDFAHKTIFGAGFDAPAAGWIKRSALSLIDDQTGDAPSVSGLWAQVEWTPRGREAVANGDYRYLSPVLMADKQGQIIGLHSVALTNDPALSNLAAVALSNQFNPAHQPPQQPKENPMLLAALIAALGLPQETTDATALTSVAALSAEVSRLKANQFDPAKHIPLEQFTSLQAQHAALAGQVESDSKAAALTAALADGRILPAQKDYWQAQPLSALSEYLKVAQPIAALAGQQTAGKGEGSKPDQAALSAEELHVCAATGISQEAFAKSKAQMQAEAQAQAQAAA